ncbi:hypothetical protein DFH29DRAFT_882689 [Suillus ampliporus]|nr:hypothetical protein DFH29DRAFT_882689 [Suillus ampliporus]
MYGALPIQKHLTQLLAKPLDIQLWGYTFQRIKCACMHVFIEFLWLPGGVETKSQLHRGLAQNNLGDAPDPGQLAPLDCLMNAEEEDIIHMGELMGKGASGGRGNDIKTLKSAILE